jgi:hypothetical protein
MPNQIIMKTKPILLVCTLLVLFFIEASGQVSVNNNGIPPNGSAMLDVQSTDRGMLIPRMTTSQRTGIGSPAEGLLVYDTDTKSFWYVKNSSWTEISSGSSGWSLTGNAGTDPAVNFIGTTDNIPLRFKVNNQQSGWLDPTGNGNTGFGYLSLFSNSTGFSNTAIGDSVLYYNNSGYANSATGDLSLLYNTTGSGNTANGYAALYKNTTGTGNTAFGGWALMYNTEGKRNTAIGATALCFNTTGNANVAIGTRALYNNTVRSNLVAIGDSALYNNGVGAVEDWEAAMNTAVGSKALFSNTTGSWNTANGYRALYNNTTGHDNTANGFQAGLHLTGGNGNIFIGSSSGPSSNQVIDSSMWLGSTRENKPAIYSDLTDGRIGIGTETPDNSALLDMSSTTKGFLPPRMTLAQIESIANPADGLMVYCTTDRKFYAFVAYENTWKEILYGSATISPQCSFGITITINHLAGDVAPVNKTVTYGIVTGIPGEPTKCWITSNLGADQQAVSVDDASEASAGWYWQFNLKQGYKHDGITRTPNTTWITEIIGIEDMWLPTNDPCTIELGEGWRIPAYTEWNNVVASGGWGDWNGPWNSDLKLHAAGRLNLTDGSLVTRGTHGYYWSSGSWGVPYAYSLDFWDSFLEVNAYDQMRRGNSVRCLRDD